MTYKHILRTYNSLVLLDVPHDLASIILDFTGEFSETESDLANKICVLQVTHPTEKWWFYRGFLCLTCKHFFCGKTKQSIHRHFNSKMHKRSLNEYVGSNDKLSSDYQTILTMWQNSLKKACCLSDKDIASISKDVGFEKISY